MTVHACSNNQAGVTHTKPFLNPFRMESSVWYRGFLNTSLISQTISHWGRRKLSREYGTTPFF